MEIEVNYKCYNCKLDWSTYLDYFDNDGVIEIGLCPLCSMPLSDMIKDVYEEEGLKGIVVQLFKRLF